MCATTGALDSWVGAPASVCPCVEGPLRLTTMRIMVMQGLIMIFLRGEATEWLLCYVSLGLT